MPSHPDRVRANYHTVETVVSKHPPTDQVAVKLTVTKAVIASWSSVTGLRHSLVKQLYTTVEELLGR